MGQAVGSLGVGVLQMLSLLSSSFSNTGGELGSLQLELEEAKRWETLWR